MNLFSLSRLLLCLSTMGLPVVAAELPSAEEFNANWPRFRGPGGSGVYAKSDLPLASAKIEWSADVPAAGFSSPVVWGDNVFLSGGDEDTRTVMCFDAASGKLRWQKAVPKTAGSPDEKPEVPDQCGMAAATVATDGRRVYAMFANGDLAAFNFDGSIAWSKYLAAPKNPYGHATSLLTWQDRVLVQFDQGEADDKLSNLYALDGATGEEIWKQPRPAGASWATPISFEAAGKEQILTLANPFVISYAAQDGAELWRADLLNGEVTPSPIFANGTVFVVSPSNKLQTIRPDGQGDVSNTHLGWLAEDGVPDVTSPVCNGELVFLIDSGGTLTCYDARTGKKQWTHDMEEECQASPSIVGKQLVLITKKGTLIVLDAGREFKELGRLPLEEEVFASPAFANGKMFVRGMKHLMCIRAK